MEYVLHRKSMLRNIRVTIHVHIHIPVHIHIHVPLYRNIHRHSYTYTYTLTCACVRVSQIPGGTLWSYLKTKHTYRFQAHRFLLLLHVHQATIPRQPSSPPPPPHPLSHTPPPLTTAAVDAGGGESGRGEWEKWRENDAVWRETDVALSWVSRAVEEACWKVCGCVVWWCVEESTRERGREQAWVYRCACLWCVLCFWFFSVCVCLGVVTFQF